MSTATRASESRVATTRPAIGGEVRRRLDVDLTGLPDDMEACFVREYCLGERHLDNVQAAMDRGYRPASVEMFPNANPIVLPGDADETHGLIRRGGQILMIREKRIGDAERNAQHEDVKEQQRAAQRIAQAPEAALDGKNFSESKDNVVRERSAAGERVKPAEGKGKGTRFDDA